MLQPRMNYLLGFVLILLVDSFQGQQYNIQHTPRIKQQDDKDVTTVLLVDSRGRSSFGRYLNVKPDLGLITSTARTFIQEGVTTEYATQILGTTLDNGRLYAHLLTKSSRVLYDDNPSSKTPHEMNKKWIINENAINARPFLNNIEFVVPTNVQNADMYSTSSIIEEDIPGIVPLDLKTPEEELLKEEPSNNYRIPFDENLKKINAQNNVKVFRISPEVADITHENIILHKEPNDKLLKNTFTPSKVRAWDNLPTFTVRNEFSPSGLSFLGDLPEFEYRTERSKLTTPAERKAKLLFKAGLSKPNARDLTTVTYTGFADFTTTVGDTVIIFSPHTAEPIKNKIKASKVPPKISVTIQPTTTLLEPPLATNIKTFLSQEPPMETTTFKGPELKMKTTLPTMVIDKFDRSRDPKSQVIDEHLDMDAKSAVLAHEQGKDTTSIFSPEVIQPSETAIPMLTTPSDEDIAKIFASLQAQEKESTETLTTESSSILESSQDDKLSNTGGATTIFFDDDPFESTSVSHPQASVITEEVTTEADVQLTTFNEEPTTNEPLATTENIISTIPNEITTPDNEIVCDGNSKVIPTTSYKTLTYLTTFFIPTDDGITTTSIKSNEVVSSDIQLQTVPCGVVTPSSSITTTSSKTPTTTTTSTTTTTEEITTTEQQKIETTTNVETEKPETTTEQEATTLKQIETTTAEVTTEEYHVTESETEPIETTTEDGDELEIIYKTLYTTYTYLTTYFQESTSSIASRTVVTTNVITSTLDPKAQSSVDSVEGIMDEENSASYKTKSVSFDDLANISPTSEETATASPIDSLDKPDLSKATPTLDDNKILPEGIKTYYTTYTYFTTIFVDGETEISSRTEVYTNYVTPSILPTATQSDILSTDLVDDEDEYTSKKLKLLNKIKPQNSYNTINRQKSSDSHNDELTTENNEISDNTLDLSEYETIATMVTDVRSTTSEGNRRILDNVDKRNVLDDQIFSESNNDSEIIPSPTLLLQTSYTTFTYFTTMYHGTTSSNVFSRLETVTNVVTQTLEPTQIVATEDPNAPVTYFTTFTYWTTLYKDGTTKITSREETVTNVETASIKATTTLPFIASTPAVDYLDTSKTEIESTQPSTVGDDELTTYYTTYTYYTTSYIGDSTVLNSRLETVTNVLNNSADIDSNYIGRAIGSHDKNQIDTKDKPDNHSSTESTIKPTGLLSTILNTIENNGTTTLLSTDVYGTYIDGLYAKVLESTSSILTTETTPSPVSVPLKPTGVVSINKGKIVDAEGVSTLLYQTQAIGTYIDNLYAQVVESTSSLTVDEEKKSNLPTDLPIAHRTGLVRLIEGSIVQNDTTTFYESKVLGTIIDGRYAQIIESTSSFLVGQKSSIAPTGTNEINPSTTQGPEKAISATKLLSPSPVAIEGSFSDVKNDDESTTEENEEDEDDKNNKGKSRLTFQSKKRTFTPAIRPFASRQRPSFAPKRKQTGQSTAATITRSDFTPTVTAVPASSKGRFGSRRSSSTASTISPTASGSKRFSRPKTSSAGGFNRNRSSSRIQPTSTAGARRSGFRTSSSIGGPNSRSSSLFGARPRIRPTLSSGLARSPSSNVVTQTPPDDENNLTTLVTDDPSEVNEGGETTLDEQTTTEPTSRRSQNPLLKFRRPPLSRTTPTRTSKSGKSFARPFTTITTTTTTPRPRTTRPNNLINRNRSGGLFPRRGLFTTTTTASPDEEDEDLVEEGDPEEDTDYDSSLRNTQTAEPPTPSTQKPTNRPRGVQIKPFFRKRTRRDTYSRFRRPKSSTTTTTSASNIDYIDEETEKPQKAYRGRYSKSRTTTSTSTTTTPAPNKRIKPSKASGQSRTQFTLRESDKRSSYKRPTSSPKLRNRNTSRTNSNLRFRNNYQTESTRKATTNRGQSSRTTNRGRGTQRQKLQNDDNNNYILPEFDGTITVTRHIPTEVTIPVVNGKITEYKNIVTAKYSTEVLGPSQYTTSVNALGKDVTVLLSENTDITNGATLITQYVLKETPTTSVIFTPTYIQRRKTSFSHIIPSTIYEIEPVVNTIQPAFAAQAPLANILLSQLLLGGIQPQQNALLGLQGIQGLQGVQQPATPSTEFKTRTTTYVTTVTQEISTVIPLTFRGKEILTTILDSSITVLTATEFLTDTIVVTPTLGFQPQQLNTALLLPLLQQQLQQQQQQQQQQVNNFPPPQQPANVFNLNEAPNAQALFQEEEKLNFAVDDEVEDEPPQKPIEVKEVPSKRKNNRKSKKTKSIAPVEPVKETSVITLYVSGRTPGEFTTVLSTVTVDDTVNRNRREIETRLVVPSMLLINPNTEIVDNFLMAGVKDVPLEASEVVGETESLESIIGDVSTYFTTKSPQMSSKVYNKDNQKVVYIKSSKKSDDFLA